MLIETAIPSIPIILSPAFKPALYVSKENTLVKTLCEVYNRETNSNLEPIAIGGATYARAF